MEKNKAAWVLAALLILMSASACAKTIRLEPSLSYQDILASGPNDFKLSLVNKGDEPAYDVRATLLLPEGFKANTIYYQTLPPGENKSAVITVEAAESAPQGTDYSGLLINYADANRYPFSSIYPVLINHKAPTSSRVVGSIEKTVITSVSAESKVTISNRDSVPHDVTLTMILPDELSAEPSKLEASLNPGEEIARPLTITARGALDGSTYVIFGKITYREGGLNYASSTRSEVKIAGTKPDNPLPENLLPVAAAATIIAAIIYYHMRKKPKKPGKRN